MERILKREQEKVLCHFFKYCNFCDGEVAKPISGNRQNNNKQKVFKI